ncbi:MAG TPA: hypothetical protein VFR04_04620 [Solirubrobacterales bacterium]|nr:hypothetical protein [Solirubrobacterales bacterium]
MPFHVEIDSVVNRARVFNLEQEELRRDVLEPWVAGLPFKFAGQGWEPRESRLTVLSSPTLGPDADGDEEDWEEVLRAAEDVTRSLLEAAEQDAPAQLAVVVEADSVEAALQEMRSGQPPRQITWPAAIERLASHDPDVKAVVLVVKPRGLDWPTL